MPASMELVKSSAPLALLAGLLLAACWFDIRSHRIPNRLVIIGMASGIACNGIAASGLGFVSALHPGGLGVMGAVAGALTGLAVLFPLYVMRGMGAGDVKLMGMIGAFLGPLPTIDATLAAFVMGGLLAVAVAVWRRTVRQAFENIWVMLRRPAAETAGAAGASVPRGHVSAGKVPYAIALASGTFAYALLALAGHTFVA